MTKEPPLFLAPLLVLYGAASLLHFIHNAEFLADYPSLPASWTRSEVYWAWLGMTAVGICGWLLTSRGLPRLGMAVLMIYAGFGLESLGHYALAPMAAHSAAMNLSILTEVGCAAVLLLYLMSRFAREFFHGVAADSD